MCENKKCVKEKSTRNDEKKLNKLLFDLNWMCLPHSARRTYLIGTCVKIWLCLKTDLTQWALFLSLSLTHIHNLIFPNVENSFFAKSEYYSDVNYTFNLVKRTGIKKTTTTNIITESLNRPLMCGWLAQPMRVIVFTKKETTTTTTAAFPLTSQCQNRTYSIFRCVHNDRYMNVKM